MMGVFSTLKKFWGAVVAWTVAASPVLAQAQQLAAQDGGTQPGPIALLRRSINEAVRAALADPAELGRRLFLTVLIVGGAIGLRLVLGRWVNRMFKRLHDQAERSGTLAAHANRIESSTKKLFSVTIVVVVLLLVLRVWGLGPGTMVFAGSRLADNVSAIIFVVIGSWVAWHGIKLAIEFLLLPRGTEEEAERSARTRTLVPLMVGASRLVIATIAALLVLSELGLNIGPLLAGAGIAGIAIGFGAQSLVKDFLNGAIIIVEDTVAVGDVAKVAGHVGVIERMGVRTIRLRDLSGVVHTVPYGEVGTIENWTKEFSMAVMDIGVAYREDVDNVVGVIEEVAAELQQDPEIGDDILEPLEVLGLDRFDDSAVVIRCRFKTKPIRQWAVKRAFNRRLKKRFDAEGIEIPFPHRTLYFGVDKAGTAPAAHVSLDDAAAEKLAADRESAAHKKD